MPTMPIADSLSLALLYSLVPLLSYPYELKQTLPSFPNNNHFNPSKDTCI